MIMTRVLVAWVVFLKLHSKAVLNVKKKKVNSSFALSAISSPVDVNKLF